LDEQLLSVVQAVVHAPAAHAPAQVTVGGVWQAPEVQVLAG
jgi:hypothetical protein